MDTAFYQASTTDSYNQDNLLYLTHYKSGKTTTCSRGFSKNIGAINSESGTENIKFTLPTYDHLSDDRTAYVLHTIPDSDLEPLRQKYRYEYIIDSIRDHYELGRGYDRHIYRTHYFSDSTIQTFNYSGGAIPSGHWRREGFTIYNNSAEGITWFDYQNQEWPDLLGHTVHFQWRNGTIYLGTSGVYKHALYAERTPGANGITGCSL